MTKSEILSSLFGLIGGLCAYLAVLMTVRAANRRLPLLSVSKAAIGTGGLNLSIRNEGTAPAIDVELRLRGDHDGTLLFQHDSIGIGSVVQFGDVCPAASAFEMDLTYRHVGGIGFRSRRGLRRSGSGPLRVIVVEDRMERRRLRDWMSDMMKR